MQSNCRQEAAKAGGAKANMGRQKAEAITDRAKGASAKQPVLTTAFCAHNNVFWVYDRSMHKPVWLFALKECTLSGDSPLPLHAPVHVCMGPHDECCGVLQGTGTLRVPFSTNRGISVQAVTEQKEHVAVNIICCTHKLDKEQVRDGKGKSLQQHCTLTVSDMLPSEWNMADLQTFVLPLDNPEHGNQYCK